MPEVNCDSRVHPTSVAHTKSLGFLSNPRATFVINGPMTSLFDLKSGKFHLVICQRESIAINGSRGRSQSLIFPCCAE